MHSCRQGTVWKALVIVRREAMLWCATLSVVAASSPGISAACAPAPMPGFDVGIAGETALIVWDPETKIEHFVRTADFRTESPELGFLVPTPTIPELGEVSAADLFDSLAQLTRPRRVYLTKSEWRFGLGFGSLGDEADTAVAAAEAGPAPSGPAAVEVVNTARVGGYDATVLKAVDADALHAWLSDRRFEASASLRDWLRVYTSKGWIITAFALAGDGRQVQSNPVRMSFLTERPFYPYREPAGNSSAESPPTERLLRVYVVTDGRQSATIGADRNWHADTVWSGPLPEATTAEVMSKLGDPVSAKFEDRDSAYWLTEFEDHASPRPGFDELYFAKSNDQTPLERPPIVHHRIEYRDIPGWYGTLACLLLALISCGLLAGRLKGGGRVHG